MNIALNIGCHDIHMTGFVNIDIDPEMHPDLLWDCTRLREKFEDGSVSCINAGHFLEHLSVQDGKKVVKDAFDLLAPFGVFVATCPDYSKVDGMTIEEKERIIMAEGTHLVLMDGQRLKSYLTEAGFLTSVVTSPDNNGLCPFPNVKWQTSIIGIKHHSVRFHAPLGGV